jgi:hypothetical protein
MSKLYGEVSEKESRKLNRTEIPEHRQLGARIMETGRRLK